MCVCLVVFGQYECGCVCFNKAVLCREISAFVTQGKKLTDDTVII